MLCQHFHNNFTTNFIWQGIFDIKLRPTIARNKKYCKNVLCQCNCVCTYKYLKEKTKRAQAKLAYSGKKKSPMNGADCQIIVKIL